MPVDKIKREIKMQRAFTEKKIRYDLGIFFPDQHNVVSGKIIEIFSTN